MALTEQRITTASFYYRLIKFLLRKGTLADLQMLKASRPTDEWTLIDNLERHAAERPEAIAILYEDRQLTWREFNTKTNQYARYFQARGVGHGDAIAINVENRPELLCAIFACLKLGAIAGMVNTSQAKEALSHSLKLIEPTLILVGSECLENMASVAAFLSDYADKMLYLADNDAEDGSAPAALPAGYVDLAAAAAAMASDNAQPEQALTLGDKCFYIFTSGTTGMPKASITTHLKLFRGATLLGVTTLTLTKKDVFYCTLPLYHTTGLAIGAACCIISGATLALRRKFSASRFWDDCRKFNATCFVYIGELLRYLLAQPARSDDRKHKIRGIVGNGLRPDIWMTFKERFGIKRIHEFYGSSEGNSGFVNFFNFDKTVGWSPEHGTAWVVVEFDIDNDEAVRGEDGRMRVLDVGESGLLITKITEQNPYDGYTNPEATESKVLRDVFEDGDAWFNTGDLLTLQPCGHLQFADRIGDTFRWQGENVATTEVEGAIMGWDQVSEAIVYGVQVPGRDGRCGMLNVTLKSGETLSEVGFIAHMREGLPAYAVPRFIRISPAVSLTGTFKFQKSTLKQEAYQLDQVQDTIYLLARDATALQQLTPELVEQIDSGTIKL